MPRAKRVEIAVATEVQQLARGLISDYHPHLANEEDVQILYLFTSQTRTARGRPVIAATLRLTPLQRYLQSGDEQAIEAGADFLVLVSAEQWRLLREEQKRAVVDRALLHIRYDEDRSTYALAPLDFDGFYEELERHGAWNADLEGLEQVMQPRLIPAGAGV